jgi:hypothetical protein
MAGKFDITIPERISSLEAKHDGLDRRVNANYKLMTEIDGKLDQVLDKIAEARGAAKLAKVMYGGLSLGSGGLAGWIATHLSNWVGK